jgi:hypothetical protein
MGLNQFQRGMRHRLKYIQLRLRLQVRHLSRHRKARKAVVPLCEAPLPRRAPDRPQTEPVTLPASASPTIQTVPFPTLRRPVDRKPRQ